MEEATLVHALALAVSLKFSYMEIHHDFSLSDDDDDGDDDDNAMHN